MYKIFSSGLLILVSFLAIADDYTITPFAGYQFGGHFNTEDGEAQIKDSGNAGISLDISYTSTTTLQFFYSYQDTTLQLKDNFLGTTDDLFDLTVEYFHFGGTNEYRQGEITSFVSASMGATHFSPSMSGVSSETLFSMSIGMGIIKKISSKLSFRVQGRILAPIQSSASSIFCSEGGCAVNLRGNTSIIQADVTAGLGYHF